MLLSSNPAYEVAGEAADGLEAICFVRSRKPAVVLLGLSMPRLDGVGAKVIECRSRWSMVEKAGRPRMLKNWLNVILNQLIRAGGALPTQFSTSHRQGV